MRVIAVMNYKGGVGKTTFTACIGQALALTSFRVLLIDNDGQHDLSTMLGVGTTKPTIRDVYHGSIGPAAQQLMKAIRETDLPCLHVIPSENDLRNADVTDPYLLKKAIAYAALGRFYDYVLIDNAPGMDALQMSSVHASDEIFVPTELKQFATSGLRDMQDVLARRYPDDCKITRIVPIFYRDTKAQNRFWQLLELEFPGKVARTPVPYDSVFDEIVSEGKNLYLHRFSSRGAAYYLKLMHELFGLSEESTWGMVVSRRRQRQSEEARDRLLKRRTESGMPAISAAEDPAPATVPDPQPSADTVAGDGAADGSAQDPKGGAQ